MITETLSIISIIIMLLANLSIFYLQNKFTKGFMKRFVMNSALCIFFILAERVIDAAGEFIYGINNVNYHIISIFFILCAILFFYRAVRALEVVKSYVPEGIKMSEEKPEE